MAGETILLVDDEQNILDLARLYLEAEGFQVLEARD
ncbi:MAG: DNA-binding response regulator, partial [Anaerolineae bacterium]|nr:DNA-binding response regulator [Anaerolineae bacterium]